MNGNEYKNAVATCDNLRVEDGILRCDISFLKCEKEYEDKLKELAERGIAIGVSSVGYGEYEADGKTIKPETYEMVRILDFEEKTDPEEVSSEAMAERKGIIRDFVENLF